MKAAGFAFVIAACFLCRSAEGAGFIADGVPTETPDETYAELMACMAQKGPASKMSPAEVKAASEDCASKAKGLTVDEFLAMGEGCLSIDDDRSKAPCLAAIDEKLRRSFASGGPSVSSLGITSDDVAAITRGCPSLINDAEKLRCLSGVNKLTALVSNAAGPQTVQLKRNGGVYVVPVLVNNAITLDFVIDSGAADVSIPVDVALTLIRAGTIAGTDLFGTRTYRLADGSQLENTQVHIREMKVGNVVVSDVRASVSSMRAVPLLGQSFLSRLSSWSVDNSRHLLVLSGPVARPSIDDILGPPSVNDLLRSGLKALGQGDKATAERWFEQAADAGGAAAMRAVGRFYEAAPSGGDPDALRWYKRAADRGDATAAEEIAQIYMWSPRTGTRAETCPTALFWYQKAAAGGNNDAKGFLQSGAFDQLCPGTTAAPPNSRRGQ
jgi:clan AA aspartic protease (TIGR02281 family)